ncbi:hypothetical protein [Paenibacillus kandeliae]|uniref:hypothetical protein n=1 Tax=Paenibacillus kandeliae TaxID=3231269 RepID=UPI00345A66F5
MSKSKNLKQSENDKLIFAGYRIVDADGNVIGTDPSQFPELIHACAEVSALIMTGKHYRVVKKD